MSDMKLPDSPHPHVLQDKAFLLLVLAVSLAFGWILWPFFGAVFWATILAILFAPLYRRLAKSMRQRRTLAALATVTIVVLLVILPTTLITASLLQEAAGVYQRAQSGELSVGHYMERVLGALPSWGTALLERFGMTSLGDVQEKLSGGLMAGMQFLASRAVNVGQNTFDFIVSAFLMLYLLFFLLRDGGELVARMRDAIPLQEGIQRRLFGRFANVVRATTKGTVAVAIVQGALGGLIFWLLGIKAAVFWAVVMGFLSLLPAVGTALVWAPAALYFLLTGTIWRGIILIAYGVLVIGMVDNLLRPILVGKDTKMPDYVVLISTLGGMAIFGINGFVIGPVVAAMFMTV
ncbi:MAG TPA: AI-2E family transporter, partial [Povalibacter sp.]|nr:AI-2E family transporter [Povalibacter sp.]